MIIKNRSCTAILIIFSGLIVTYFDSTEIAIAATENQLISLYKSKKYSELVKSLSQESESKLNAQKHYLLLKSFNQTKNFQQSKSQLINLEQKLPIAFGNLLLYEKLNLFKRSGQKEEILKVIAEYRGSAFNPFLLNRITKLLTTEFKSFKNKPLLQHSLERIIPYAATLEKGPDLLRLYATIFANDNPRKTKIQLDIWKLDDVENLTKSEQAIANTVKNKIGSYGNDVFTHFKNQKKYKNYSYTIKSAPQFLKLINDKKSNLFVDLRNLYFHSMIKKRKLSSLINTLDQSKNRKSFGLTEYEAVSIQFDLMVRKGDTKSAIAVLNRMIKMDPGRDLDSKFLALGKYYFHRNYYEQALYFFNRIRHEASLSYKISDVKWYIWRAHFLMGNQTKLTDIAQWAKLRDFEDKEMGARFCYWGYKLNLYKDNNLNRCYEQFPLTYYGLHSKFSNHQQINESVKPVATSQVFAKVEQVSALQKNHLNLLRIVYQLNEGNIADSIIRSMLSSANPNLMLALARVLLEAERYYMVQIIVESKFRSVLEKNISGRKLLLPYFYPLAYDKEISKLEKKPNVPKSLILSVMREESHFNPQIKSTAGAIGLMQLMPGTAKYVGQKIGLKIKPGSLVNPKINLKLGSAYLKQLMKRYKGNLFYTLAAYNGGPTNVKRWIKKTKTRDNDDFVESITFLETQNYVRRVMRTFYIYRDMYEKL